MKGIFILTLLSLLLSSSTLAEDGYRLWLRYESLADDQVRNSYLNSIRGWVVEGQSPTLDIIKSELARGLNGLLGTAIPQMQSVQTDGILVAGTPTGSSLIASLQLEDQLRDLGEEGFVIQHSTVNQRKIIAVAGNEDIAVLYGIFHFLRMLQTHQTLDALPVKSVPKLDLRILNHWDNLDRTVERGYAGFSIWDWHKLPEYIDTRYEDYARANASIGINGTVLTNVNANALVLRPDYLEKVAALADLFRPYGIQVFLTARFSAPINLGQLETADPLVAEVQQWWNDKVKEIYTLIPDFGGFLVKANSEGQPGPQNYQRSHADGANMLANALLPHGGIVMWRAFVYDEDEPEDRAKQAYNEFKPLDGTFRKNVLIQVKNGPIDFQPREPIHPLFGAMPKTPVMMEFQITQEYLGQGTSLVYLAPMYKEVLDFDTYAKGKGSTVARVLDGSVDDYPITGMAGVSNIGTDRNWTGHPAGQANWYAYGRLAWNYELSAEQIAEEWIRMTYSNNPAVVRPVKSILLSSYETLVKYMTPLGLHHIMARGHHYGPGPWVKEMPRADWTSVYYHKADSIGVGFDRTRSGSNAIEQYFPSVQQLFASPQTIPLKYLLWFHRVEWDQQLPSGKTLWETLCHHYYDGAREVEKMKEQWQLIKGKIDDERHERMNMLLNIQIKEAKWWRNACVLYFQSFSGMPIPDGLEKPEGSLDYYMNLNYPYAPGIRPRW